MNTFLAALALIGAVASPAGVSIVSVNSMPRASRPFPLATTAASRDLDRATGIAERRRHHAPDLVLHAPANHLAVALRAELGRLAEMDVDVDGALAQDRHEMRDQIHVADPGGERTVL